MNEQIISYSKIRHDMILSFIADNFTVDCHWLDGNCYYFAVILNTRFAESTIVYDVVNNHFSVRFADDRFYDWSGEIKVKTWVVWEDYILADLAHSSRIIRDCIVK